MHRNAAVSMGVCLAALILSACGPVSSPGAARPGGGGSGAGGSGAGGSGGAGSGGATSSKSGGSPSSATTTACLLSGLRITVDLHAAGVATGTSYLPLDFTNIGSARCRLAGYPAVAFAASAGGRQLGAAGAVDSHLATRQIVLAPGQAAHIWLHVIDALNYPAARCQPVTAAGLRVGLPGQTATAYLRHPSATCIKPMHGSGILTIEPFRAGLAKRGTAQ